MPSNAAAVALEIADWRRRIFSLYCRIRELAGDPVAAHQCWCEGRNELFAHHPASPLVPEDRGSFRALPVAEYDAAWRFELEVVPASELQHLDVPTGTDGVVPFDLLGHVDVPGAGEVAVWRLASYGGGLFLPIKDGLAGTPGGTYSGGRYVLDTIKGADLGPGRAPDTIVIDFNFAYNPSCAYDPAWACPLAPGDNIVTVDVPAGERSI